jgi:hypothetical protein
LIAPEQGSQNPSYCDTEKIKNCSQSINKNTNMLHCWATLATASRSIVNLGSTGRASSAQGIQGQTLIRTSALQDRFELTVDKDISISSDRRGEMRIERNVQSIMLIFCNIQHSSAEIFGTMGGFEREQL